MLLVIIRYTLGNRTYNYTFLHYNPQPTKERARKPKKNRDANGQVSSHTKSAPESVKETKLFREDILPIPQSPQLPRTPSPKFFSDTSSSLNKASVPNAAQLPVDKEPTSKVAQITQKWGQSVPIGVKPVTSPSFQTKAQTLQHEMKPKTDTNLIRRALPGMVSADSLHAPPTTTKSNSPSPESTLQVLSSTGTAGSSQDASPSSTSGYTGSPSSTEGQSRLSSPAKGNKTPKSPPSPKHTRIPSTGNRALVMDVAQALNEYNSSFSSEDTKPQEEIKSPVLEPTLEPIARPRASPALERRRSSYDRFSVVSVMPPLKEEATPNGTPFGTLNRIPDTLSYNATLNGEVTDSKKRGQGLGKNEWKDAVHFGPYYSFCSGAPC